MVLISIILQNKVLTFTNLEESMPQSGKVGLYYTVMYGCKIRKQELNAGIFLHDDLYMSLYIFLYGDSSIMQYSRNAPAISLQCGELVNAFT